MLFSLFLLKGTGNRTSKDIPTLSSIQASLAIFAVRESLFLSRKGMIYVLFILGFVLLIKGADWLVDSASLLANRYGVSDMVVGLTIVSFGTSLPELTVNLMASFGGNAEIAIGNVLGSNIANVLLILGASALVANLTVKRPTVLTEIPFSLTAALLVGFFANTNLFNPSETSLIFDRKEGISVMVFFFMFLIYITDMARSDKNNLDVAEPLPNNTKPVFQLSLIMLVGIMALFLGGKWVVDGAVTIAANFGMSQSLIGLTIVAVGTSLPELVTSVVASYRGKSDIAVGNVVGSNIFNLLWVLGLSATIRPLPFTANSNADVLMIVFSSTLIILALVVSKKMVLTRVTGIFFLALYVVYTMYLVGRG